MYDFGRTAIIAAALIGLSTGIAAAVPAMVERDSNVRQGPGTNYPVRDMLQAGTVVQVDECRNGWCAVHGARPGFVAESLLSFGRELRAAPARRVVVSPGYGFYDAYPPGYYASPYPHRPYGHGFGFGFGFGY